MVRLRPAGAAGLARATLPLKSAAISPPPAAVPVTGVSLTAAGVVVLPVGPNVPSISSPLPSAVVRAVLMGLDSARRIVAPVIFGWPILEKGNTELVSGSDSVCAVAVLSAGLKKR